MICGEPEEGETVTVYSNRNECLGVGHYQTGSIAVRMLANTETILDQDFWNQRIQQAVSYRKQTGLIGNPETNVFRLVNGEGDYLPGLIADYYNGTVVIQFHSAGMYRVMNQIVEALQNSMPGMITAIYNKSEGTLPARPGITPENGYLLKERDQQPVNREVDGHVRQAPR